MVFIILFFAALALAPILAVLWLSHMEMFHFVLYTVAALATIAVLAVLVWRVARNRRRRGGGRRPAPNDSAVDRLAWRRDLDQSELEAHCATFLRHQGWTVTPVQSTAADGVYLMAEGTGTRAMVMCQPHGASVTSITLRALSAAAAQDGAKPALLTLGGVSQAMVQVADGAGVAVLLPSDLPKLRDIAVRHAAVAGTVARETDPITQPPP